MSQMIKYGGEIIRISPKDSTRLEYSKDDGRTWNTRSRNCNSCGRFLDLMDNGSELLATTDNGVFYSKSKGEFWDLRCRN